MNGIELYEWLRDHPDLCGGCRRLMSPRERRRPVANPQALLYHAECWEQIKAMVR